MGGGERGGGKDGGIGVALRAIRVGSFCSGVDGLGLGIKLAIRRARLVVFCERDSYAAANLVVRMGGKALDKAPVWDLVDTFPAREFHGCLDLLIAGYPCQPFSVAGKQLGAADPRHLWPHIARIVDEAEPPLVFLENVPGHLRLGFDIVAGDLAGMGYRVEPGLFAAEEVGAPHERKRLFILAYRESGGRRVLWESCRGDGFIERCIEQLADAAAVFGGAEQRGEPHGILPGGSGTVADRRSVAGASGGKRAGRQARRNASGRREGHVEHSEDPYRRAGVEREQSSTRFRRHRPEHAGGDAVLGDARGGELAKRGGGDCDTQPKQPAAPGTGLPLFPPCRNDYDGWQRAGQMRPDLWPAVEPGVRLLADGPPVLVDEYRVEQLRCIGNGVVPLCAAFAFIALAWRAGLLGGGLRDR